MPSLIHNPTSVGAMMRMVIYALLPGTIVSLWIYGWGPLVNIAIAVISALVAESVVLMLRQRPALPTLSDYSATLTALLLALVLPPLLPWWLPMIGAVFAIVVAKHLYGGLGYNPFNPAMAGYALLLIAFPSEMTRWPELLTPWDKSFSFSETLAFVFSNQLPIHSAWAALTGATPLDPMRTQLTLGADLSASPLGGRYTIIANIAFLAGGLWLITKRIIGWRIPVAMLASMALLATIFWLWSPSHYPTPLFHLFSGAAMLGAFFIATDPVTACITDRGRLWFGMGCGVLVYVIRSFGGYPDAIAFAVLIMNMAAPTIDHYSRPRGFGHHA